MVNRSKNLAHPCPTQDRDRRDRTRDRLATERETEPAEAAQA